MQTTNELVESTSTLPETETPPESVQKPQSFVSRFCSWTVLTFSLIGSFFALIVRICQFFSRIIKKLYDWVLSWANSRFGTVALGCVAFSESSFFPVPPDVLQIPLSIERPKRAYFYALVSMICSALGALLGWYIGFALWELLGPWFLRYLISQATIDKVHVFFQDWGFWALLVAAFTPIPFKAFTIAAGIAQMSVPLLFFASLVGRGLRFFLLATIIYFTGDRLKGWIDRYFGFLTFIFLILLVLGFYSIKFFFPTS